MIRSISGLINLIKSITLLFELYPKKFLIIIFFLLTLVASIAEIATISSLLPLVDLLVENNNYSDSKYIKYLISFFKVGESNSKILLLIVFTGLIVFTYIIKILIILVNSYLNHQIAFYIHNNVFKKILNQNYDYFINSNTGDILGSIEKVESIRNIVFSLLNLFMSIILASSIIVLLFVVDFMNSSILFILIGVVYLSMYFLSKRKLTDISFLQAKIIDKKYKIFLEFKQNIKEIILRNLDNYIFDKQFNIFLSLRNSRISAERITHIMTQTSVFIFTLAIITVLFFFITLKTNLNTNAPIIIFYIVAIQRLVPHVQNIYNSLVSGIKLPQYSVKDVLNILDLPDQRIIDHAKHTKEKIHINSEVSLKNLKFSHYQSPDVLFQNTNLNFKIGKIYGLTGMSGAGKTTFLDIFMGLLKMNSGDFLIDETRINIFNNPHWQNLICYVPQNSILTDGTFIENICYGEDLNKIDKDYMNDCANKALCLDFINNRKEGFNTQIGEGGSKISGGQKQRLLIARALYSRKPVLLLDEATNAIDKETEYKIFQNLENIKKDKIIIVIAHNAEVRSFFDLIYNFENKIINPIKLK